MIEYSYRHILDLQHNSCITTLLYSGRLHYEWVTFLWWLIYIYILHRCQSRCRSCSQMHRCHWDHSIAWWCSCRLVSRCALLLPQSSTRCVCVYVCAVCGKKVSTKVFVLFSWQLLEILKWNFTCLLPVYNNITVPKGISLSISVTKLFGFLM